MTRTYYVFFSYGGRKGMENLTYSKGGTSLTTSLVGDLAIIKIVGTFEWRYLTKTEEHFEEAIANGTRKLLVDLRGCDAIGTSSIELLIKFAEQLRKMTGLKQPVLVVANGAVAKAVMNIHDNRKPPVYRSIDDAMDDFV
jgi:anti-anti-sigma regulatory factor